MGIAVFRNASLSRIVPGLDLYEINADITIDLSTGHKSPHIANLTKDPDRCVFANPRNAEEDFVFWELMSQHSHIDNRFLTPIHDP